MNLSLTGRPALRPAAATIAAAALLVTSGCAHRRVQRPAPSGPCQIHTLRPLVGRPASAVLAAQALSLSGARTVRWIRKGDVVTMDLRPDRLNVHVGRDGKVRSFTCG